MKRITLIFLIVICIGICTGCSEKHNWTAPTCTSPSICSDCGLTQGEPLGHDWLPATCTEPKKCSRCLITDGEPLGHDWVEATCTEPENCARCKETKGKEKGHNWVDATCTEAKKCSVCSTTEGKPLGHSYDYVVIVDASCSEKGLEEGTCTICGEKTSRDIPPTNEHEYGEWTVVEKPSCSEYGKEETVCLNCGYKSTKKIDKLPHTDDNTWVVVKAATASSSGKKATHCKVCGAEVQTATYEIGKIVTTNDFKNMKLEDIGKVDDVYVGLSYVKKMSYLPTALGKADVKSGYECILAFFDFYNSSRDSVKVHPGDITCYADGTQVNEVETYIKVECDGIREVEDAELAGGTQLISVQNFEVPKGWQELKFFYKSKCIWTIGKNDVKDKAFKFESMYDVDSSREVTKNDYVLYSGKYEIIYNGCKIYTYHNTYSGDTRYAIFKYRINNTGDDALDTSLMGYKMTAYIDNYYIADDADYFLSDKVDGYTNIFDVDTIEVGMSANIYVAFEITQKKGSLYMIYDDGYISSAYKGTVYGVVK